MTVESTFNYPSDLNASYPAAGDARSEGDDHLRGLKSVLKTTFPGVSGAVTPTHTELNYVDGVTSAIQTQLDAKSVELVTASSPSGVSSVAFTTGLTGTGVYFIEFINVVGVSSSDLRMTMNSDGTGGNYDWGRIIATTSASATTNGSTSAAFISLTGNVDNTTAWGGFSGTLRLFNIAGTTHYKRASWIGGYPTNTTKGNLATVVGSGQWVSTSAVTNITIQFQSGNIASGKINLYKEL
jgi:hypothetical protein